jgi:transcription elongation GreA/GreB family factor
MAELSAQELCELIELGEHEAVTQAVTEQLDAGRLELPTLLAVVDALARANQSESAEVLAVMGMEALADGLTPIERADASRQLLAAVPESEELQKLTVSAHRDAYADRPHLEPLLTGCGLTDGRASRRSLRTLEVCLIAQVGKYVAGRSEDVVGQVQAIDAGTAWVTVGMSRGVRTLSPGEFAAELEPIADNDFRVLSRLRTDRFAQRLQDDPLVVLEGLLRSVGGKIDRDELKHRLCPQVIPAEQWGKWWSDVRSAIKRSTKFSISGRSPVMVCYHPGGQTLEEQIWAELSEQPSATWVTVMRGYARQLKQSKASADAALVEKVVAALQDRLRARRRTDPSEALACGLVIESLRAFWPDLVPADAWPADEMLASDAATFRLLADQPESLWPVALERGRTLWSDGWPAAYARLLKVAPTAICDQIADALIDAGHEAAGIEAIEAVLQAPAEHLNLLAWLWLGPRSASRLPMPEPAGLLTMMLSLLRGLSIDDRTPHELLRNARTRLRAALGARKAARFREVIAAGDLGLAVTCKALLERLDGLGTNLRQDLLRVIRERYPDLFVVKGPPLPPWKDPAVLYTTSAGMERKQAELQELVHVKIKQNAIAIGEAASHGDLSENSEYRFALEERDLLQAQLRQMQQEMAIARVLGPQQVDISRVSIGCRVRLLDEQNYQPAELSILGPWESDVANRVYSYGAPLAQGLLGHSCGEVVELSLGGERRRYRIEEIQSAL